MNPRCRDQLFHHADGADLKSDPAIDVARLHTQGFQPAVRVFALMNALAFLRVGQKRNHGDKVPPSRKKEKAKGVDSLPTLAAPVFRHSMAAQSPT